MLIDKFGNDKIISAVGLTVPANILLIEQCDFFVSMWGAGLAKYRWICNKPGFVITNHWNLTQRSDLFIYDHPTLIESPSRLYWVDPTLVTDHPEAPRIVTVNSHAQWSNFSIMEAPVIDAILRSISKHVDAVAECSIPN